MKRLNKNLCKIEQKRIGLVQNFPVSKRKITLRSPDRIENENRQYLQLLMSDTAAEVVTWTAMKSSIHKHPTHLDQRPLRPPKLPHFKPKQHYLVLAALGASDQDVWGVNGFHGGSNDTIGGRVQHRRPEILPIFSYPWQLPTLKSKISCQIPFEYGSETNSISLQLVKIKAKN
jgi:hypothetical protein